MGQFDFVGELAGLVPVSVVCAILGIDVGRRRVLKHAVDGLFAAANRSVYPEERLNGLRQSTNTIRMCLDDTYDRYAREPADNLTSYLIQAEGDGDKLRRPDILNILLNILMGGTETTGNLIAAALIEMHREPEIAAKVQCGDLSLSAVLNEVLRFESPAQMLWRHATGNTTIADVAIPGGSLVFPMIASANRDESVFRDPDRFDPERGREGEMIAFGRGPHFCIGFRLALMEARVTLSRVFARLGRLAPVDSQIERVDSFFTRGIARLPVSFDARAVRPKRLSHAQ
jgi:cytochrome P450